MNFASEFDLLVTEVALLHREDYDHSALDAVRLWHIEPYLLNREAVDVEADISIFYPIQE